MGVYNGKENKFIVAGLRRALTINSNIVCGRGFQQEGKAFTY
jgi:hypothetical protein